MIKDFDFDRFILREADEDPNQPTDYTAEQPPTPEEDTTQQQDQQQTQNTTQQQDTTADTTQQQTQDTTQQQTTDTTQQQDQQPTDYTAEQPPTPDQDPNAQQPTTDTTQQTPDAATTGQDQTQSTSGGTQSQGKESEVNKDLSALDKELFKDLDDSEIAIKNKKLKLQFLELYEKIIAIIDKLETIKKDIYITQVMSFVAFKLDDLKNMITDYVSEVYDNKTYIENLIYYNQCLSILSGISQILKDINIDLTNKI